MNKKITFAVTAKDDHELIQRLKSKLVSNDYLVELIALGSVSEMEQLVVLYPDISNFDALPSFRSFEHILGFSIDAFFELELVLPKVKFLTIWSDPVFTTGELESYLIEAMVESCKPGIIARTIAGQEQWGEEYQIEVPLLPTIFSDNELINCEPLIEKTQQVRVLVDGGDNLINTHLVEPFIQLERTDVEIWCVYPERLKPWMHPGMYFTNIPSEENSLYYSAVDGVIVADSNLSGQKIIDYVSAGFMPFASSVEVKDRIESFFNEGVDICLVTAPYFIETLATRENLLAYNEKSKSALKKEADFSLSILESTHVEVSSTARVMNQLAVRLARKGYYRNKYNDDKGSGSHKGYRDNTGKVHVLKGVSTFYAKITGWGVDLDGWESSYPKIKNGEKDVLVSIEKVTRPDVLEAFLDIGKSSDVGFVGHFSIENIENLTVANHIDNNKTYSDFNFPEIGNISETALVSYTRKDTIKGSLDSCLISEAIIFDLSELLFGTKELKCKIRVIKDDVIFDLSNTSQIVLSDNMVLNIGRNDNNLLISREDLDSIVDNGSSKLILSSEVGGLSGGAFCIEAVLFN